MNKKIISILVLIILISAPAFAGHTLNKDTININSPYQVITFNLSDGASYLEGSIENSNGIVVAKGMYSNEENNVKLLPVVKFKEDEDYTLKLKINSDGEDIYLAHPMTYDSSMPASDDLKIIEEILEEIVNEVTLMVYEDMNKLEKVAARVLIGLSNREKIIDWEERLTSEEATHVLVELLSDQKDQLMISDFERAEYLSERIEGTSEYEYYGIQGLEYKVGESDLTEVYNKYESVLDSLDLEGKTNREISKIIALKLVEQFDYNNSGKYDNTLQNQSFFSILHNKTVCTGYATAYAYLLNSVGLRSDFVTGNARTSDKGSFESHIWNKVYLSDDEIVYTDVTWMDDGEPGSYREEYFNSEFVHFGAPTNRKDLEEVVNYISVKYLQ